MKQGLHIAGLMGTLHHILHIPPHAREGGEVILQVRLGLGESNAQVLAQGEGGLAVDNAEVHRLGPAAHLMGYVLPVHPEHLGRRLGVEVAPRQEGRPHGLVPGDVGQDAQLNLGVVRVHQHMALRRREHPAELAAQVRPGGDVLQIRLRGAEAARGGDGHLEPRPDPPVGVHGLQQSLGVGGFQLGVLPVLQHRVHNGMLEAELFQHLGVGGPAGLRLLPVGKP